MKLLLPSLLRTRERGSSTATLDSNKLIDMGYKKTVMEPALEGVHLLNAIGRILTNVLIEPCQKEAGKSNIEYNAKTVPELQFGKHLRGSIMVCHYQK